MRWIRGDSFPLLAKELVEQATRKRTYRVRVLYVCALFVAFLIYYNWVFWESYQYQLGSGLYLFQFLIYVQMVGVYLFLPASMTGAVAVEKEKKSLTVLLLTYLRPREIILEKFIARLIPFLSLQLATLPLLAIAYSLGGVSQTHLWCGVYLVLLTSVQVGSLSLMLSSHCATWGGAFFWTYVTGALFYALGSFSLFVYFNRPLVDGASEGFFALLQGLPGLYAFPPILFAKAERLPFVACLLSSIPALLSIVVFLILACAFLVPRATVRAQKSLTTIFRAMDSFMNALNKLLGDIVIIRDDRSLLDDEPITWLETRKRRLSNARYFVRFVLLIEAPIIALILLSLNNSRITASLYSWIPWIIEKPVLTFWAISAVLTGVVAIRSLSSEQTRKILPLLLATPMPRREILDQKFKGVMRLAYLLWIPFLTLILFDMWRKNVLSQNEATTAFDVMYLAGSCLCLLIYQPMLIWLAFFLTFRAWHRFKTIPIYMAILAFWAIFPFLLLESSWFAYIFWNPMVAGIRFPCLFVLSPATMVLMLEFHSHLEATAWSFYLLLNATLYFFIMARLRKSCLENAARLLPTMLG